MTPAPWHRLLLLNHVSLFGPLRRNGDDKGAPQALKLAHEFALSARFGALRKSAVLLDRLPFLGDELERCSAVFNDARLDEPAPDDEARAANTPAAVHGGDATPTRVILQHVQDLPDIPDRAR